MPASIAVVEADENAVGKVRREQDYSRRNLRDWSQVANVAVARFDDEEVEILVAVLVLHEQDVATVSTPTVPGDRPARQSRRRLCCADHVDLSDPNVHHAINRREPGKASPIGR
jgi:hypothetical protein